MSEATARTTLTQTLDGAMVTVAAELVAALTDRRVSVAVAESLTGGLVSGTITAVPGASVVFRGGAVTYATDSKHSVLGVSQHLLDAGGPVQAEVARQMAAGVRRLFGADYAIATTGVAGPDPQAGQPVGRVFVAVSWVAQDDAARDEFEVRMFDLAGDRTDIREATVRHALGLMRAVIGDTCDSE